MKKILISLTAAGALLSQDVVIERSVKPGSAAPTNMAFIALDSGEGVKNAPYSADTVTETTQTLADGNRIVRKNKSSFARDGQGRTRRETQIQHFGPLGQAEEPLVNVFIMDPVAKVQFHLDARAKTVMRIPMAEMPRDAKGMVTMSDTVNVRVPAPVGIAGVPGGAMVRGEIRHETMIFGATAAGSGRPAKQEELGEKNFEGVSARGHRSTMVIPAGEAGNERPIEILTETWFSSELKAPVYTRHVDPRFGETVTRMTNIRLGEPAQSLFQPPADYTEAPQHIPARRIMVRDDQ